MSAPPTAAPCCSRLKLAARIGAVLALAPLLCWAAAALVFDGPAARWLALVVAGAFVLTCVGTLWIVRPFRRAVAIVAVLFLGVLVWWLWIPPSNERDWIADVARLPSAKFSGSTVTVRNVRSFDYRSETDFTEHWEERTYDLDSIVGLDLFLCTWGPKLIAHTIMSWEFADGRHLAISIETRKERGESYSALLGFFRHYELYYVVADEEDVVGLRAAHRGERVFCYRLNANEGAPRALLLDYLGTINDLARRPQWYNALVHNCTTTIRHHFKQVAPVKSLSWKLLANGYVDEMLHERNGIDATLPFPEMRRRSDVTDAAIDAVGSPDFAARIRRGLPGGRESIPPPDGGGAENPDENSGE